MKEVSGEKISALRDMILNKADQQKQHFAESARHEAEEWLSEEHEKLNREVNAILQDAKTRSEEIRRRQIMAAERDKATDVLRLQNRMLSEALRLMQDKLVRLREREDYIDILTGMCADSLASLKGAEKVSLRLAAVDMHLAEKVVQRLAQLEPEIKVEFDQEPAPILGGCWLSTEDGRRQVNSDWQSLTQEMADKLAERLLPLL
jgi:V/A-type H+-transporting ATPase subunit E